MKMSIEFVPEGDQTMTFLNYSFDDAVIVLSLPGHQVSESSCQVTKPAPLLY